EVNGVQHWGQSALMLAAKEGHIAVVRYLISKGGDIKLRDKNKDTALTLANENDQLEVAMLLRRYGATDNKVEKKPAVAFEANEDADDADSDDSSEDIVINTDDIADDEEEETEE